MNQTKITLCGDDCLKCPRCNAKTEEELSKARREEIENPRIRQNYREKILHRILAIQ